MYKVFVNDHPIILTEKNNVSTNFINVPFNEINLFEIVEKIFQNELEGINLICSNLSKCWSNFQSKFQIQKAAGGKVFNEKNEVLFIYRFNKWDLPKGKFEKGETSEICAIREVEEECGVDNLEIIKSLPTTFHIFEKKGSLILKITDWFLMKTNYDKKLTPQKEEGIEMVCFFNERETQKALQNTYSNIKLLF